MVQLPAEKLEAGDGQNTIEIQFVNTYVTNSAGLHRFQDPEDKEIYLYTHLEPFNCNRWFPCFDQPSFNSVFKLKVITPLKAWKVFSNGDVAKTTPSSDELA